MKARSRRRLRPVTEGVDMLLYAVGIGFLLLFAVLISDGISGSSAARSGVKPTDTSSRPRKSDGAAEAEAPTERPRTIGARRADDGLGRAA
jgi:hypothetical protein